MIEYSNDVPAEMRTDALVIGTNCMEVFPEGALKAYGKVFFDNFTAYKAAFDAGKIEPGKVGPKPKKVGDPCRDCKTPLIRRESKKDKPDSRYYFAWYLYCENCKKLFHVEEAKVYRDAKKMLTRPSMPEHRYD